MAQLQPVQGPMGFFTQFTAKNTETLVLKEKILSLSGDSFDVTMANGQPIFKIQGRHMTMSGRKSVNDMAGNHLFDIIKELLHLHTTYAAEDPQGKKILEVKSSIKLIGSKATIKFQSSNGQEETLTMTGNWRDTKADIVCERTGAVVARIDRQWLNSREFFGGQQTYAVHIAPGVDMAIMVAACIALDEKNNES